MLKPLNVVTLHFPVLNQRFVFLYDDAPETERALTEQLATMVQDPDLPAFGIQQAREVASTIGRIRLQRDAARHQIHVLPAGACFTMTQPNQTPTPGEPTATQNAGPSSPPNTSAPAAAPTPSGKTEPPSGPPNPGTPPPPHLTERAERKLPPDLVREARDRALKFIRDIDLDTAVREIARSGKFDGTANYGQFWQGLRFECTEGAGTNGATVRVSGAETLLYEVLNYGQHVSVFRPGSWVDGVLDHANELYETRRRHEAATADDRARAELEKFAPWEPKPSSGQTA